MGAEKTTGLNASGLPVVSAISGPHSEGYRRQELPCLELQGVAGHTGTLLLARTSLCQLDDMQGSLQQQRMVLPLLPCQKHS